MIRLVCIDVDGTLVGTSGTVHDEVWAGAARMRAAGVRLALCTGRPGFGDARGYAGRLDPAGWHVFQNGASIVRLDGAESVSEPLGAERVAWLVARAAATGRVLELYSDAEYAVESDAPIAREHAELLGVPFSRRPFGALAGAVVRGQWIVPASDAPAVLAEPHPGIEISGSTSPLMPGTMFLNMTPAGVSKASAVRRVAHAYGVPLAEVMFVGDGDNDLGAMGVVGTAVAMGNAEPAVRAAAHRTVGHVDRGGLLEAFALAGARAPSPHAA
jgi:Cof subfamily protein (haloacid dehalogenase superfamily)